jgi:tetratricopeptide (TPR) repeat protein
MNRRQRRAAAHGRPTQPVTTLLQEAAAHHRAGRVPQALALLDRAVATAPDAAEIWSNRSVMLVALGRPAEALASCDRALALRPEFADALSNRGGVLVAMGRRAEAAACYARAAALNPSDPAIWANQGRTLLDLDRPAEAVECFRRALALRHGDAELMARLAFAQAQIGRLEDALATTDAALAANPEEPFAHLYRGFVLLTQGRYTEGWPEYDWRWRIPGFTSPARNFPQPQWRGEPLAGRTILLHAEQGFGDMLQFCRYAPMVAGQGGTVLLEVPASLRPLMQGLAGVSRVLVQGEALPAFDLHCPLMSLPLAFATTPETIPAPTSYLQADPARMAHWAPRLAGGPGPRIGLVWSGNIAANIDPYRSIPFAVVRSLLTDGVTVFALQATVADGDRASLDAEPGVTNLGAEVADWADTAAIVAQLDLVISIDTAVAHLAGAMGVATWTMLKSAADWRWGTEISDSPWYPTMRLFRQSERGDWDGVVARVRAALDEYVAAWRPRPATAQAATPTAATPTAATPTAATPTAAGHIAQAGALARSGRPAEADAAFCRALALDPRSAETWSNRAVVLAALGRNEEALACCDRALGLLPEFADALGNKGAVLVALARRAEAVAYFARAAALKPDDPVAWTNHGSVLSDLHRPVEALASLERALALRPGDAELLAKVGFAQWQLGRFAESLASTEAALARQPDEPFARVHRAWLHLADGRFADGWHDYEFRWRLPRFSTRPRAFQQSQWRGEPLAGRTLLLHAEQGMGDTIQFCRYVALAAERGGRAILEVPPPLLPLLAGLPGAARVVAAGDALPPFDLHCPLMSLPLAFGTTLETIPAPAGYLRADPARVARWAPRLAQAGAGPRVGLVWAGNPEALGDRVRSMPLSVARPLAEAGATIVSLQKTMSAADRAEIATLPAALDSAGDFADFADTAAVIAQLDLVIAVDTSVAHLAAALGRPTWLLLPAVAEWRWLRERDDSPWYPTMRLFRQSEPGDWAGLVTRVRAALDGFVADWQAPQSAEILAERGFALAAQGRGEEALACFAQVAALRPDDATAWAQHGTLLSDMIRPAAALTSFDKALALRPDDPDLLAKVGFAQWQLARFDAALATFDSLLARWPDHAFGRLTRAHLLLAEGRFAEGWRDHEYRWQAPRFVSARREFGQPQWRGEPLEGRTLLLHAEQGFGDTIQFCRYATLAAERGGVVILQAYPSLLPLLAGLPGVSRLLAPGDDLPPFDLHCPLMSLPLAFGTTLESIPAPVGYLRADPVRVAHWAPRLAGATGPRVGLVWAGNSSALMDRVRSLPLHAARSLTEAGATIVALQKTMSAADRGELATFPGVLDLGGELADFADTAAVIAQLDLVIAVDTAVAHLAAALGKPTWVLLATPGDWRWLRGRADSPWYPTARLFRQNVPGEWGDVVADVRTALGAFVAGWRPAEESAEDLAKQGVALRDLGRLDEALACLDRAVALNPDFSDAWVARGVTLVKLDRPAEALAGYDRALALRPGDQEAIASRCFALWQLGRLDEALASADAALAARPDFPLVRFYRAQMRLAVGRYAEGWQDHECRWELRQFRAMQRRFEQPQWRGEPLAGRTILLHAEQGFGDTLQFCRFAPLVAARGGTVILLVPPALVAFLTGLAGVTQVIAFDDKLPPFDLHSPLMSLPLALGTILQTIPAEPYLTADPARVAHWAPRFAGVPGPRVGIVWAGNPSPLTDQRRFLPLAAIRPLLRPGRAVFALQKDPSPADRAELAALGVVNLADACAEWADTAAAIAHLDVVITIDSAVAHVAGAMGKPVWVLLRSVSDWRWMLTREDSTWYPTARLFRQTAAGGWDGVVARVDAALDALPPDGRPATTPAEQVQIAVGHLQAGWLDDAAAACRRALAAEPEHAEALHLLGLVFYQTGRLTEADGLIGRSLALVPDNAAALNNHGLVLCDLQRPAEALRCFDRALALAPDFAEAHCNRGTALRDLGRMEEALGSYGRAVALRPDYPDAWSNHGTTLTDLGRPAEALDSLDRALASDPGHAAAHNNKGTALHALGRLAAALASFDRACALAPDEAEPKERRAAVLADLSR